MKGRPILMSAPMVCALLEGRKTQARRVAKVKYEEVLASEHLEDWEIRGFECVEQIDETWLIFPPCPYGQPGDLLWVRETWAMASRAKDIAKIYYKAHENASHTEFHEYVSVEKVGHYQPTWPNYKPSIHMPRWASRLTLEITNIRKERLQNISEADAIAEGVTAYRDICANSHKVFEVSAARAFHKLWSGIHGHDAFLHGASSLEANPWVWAISFIIHKQNIDDFLQKEAA